MSRLELNARNVHRWCGWLLGALLVLQAFTGVVSAFRAEINALLYEPDDAGASAPVRAGKIVAEFEARFPELTFERLFFPGTLMGGTAVVWARDSELDLRVAVYDPARAQLIRAGPVSAFPAELVFFLHVQLLCGRGGQIMVGMCGLLLVLMGLTGYSRWRRTSRVQRATPARVAAHASAYIRWLSRHRSLGVALLALALLLGATGAFLGLKAVAAPSASQIPVQRAAAPDASAIDRAVHAARERWPAGDLWSLSLDSARPGHVTVLVRRRGGLPPRATDQLTVDAHGRIEAEVTFTRQPLKSRLSAWAHGLHSGEWLGPLAKPLMMIAAFGLGAMAVMGYALTALRTRRPRT